MLIPAQKPLCAEPAKCKYNVLCSYSHYLSCLQIALSKLLREFQEEPIYKSPGPHAYKPDGDPGKKLETADKPLTNKKSFIDNAKATIPNGKRESAFGGNFKIYLDHGFERSHHNAGSKLGPGPAGINLRDVNEGIPTFHHKKTSSVKTTMNLE